MAMDFSPAALFDLSANVDAYLAARGDDTPPLPAQADERVRAYDARIAERLQAGEQELLKGLSARGLTLRFNSELNLAHDLHRVTRFFLKFWRLSHYFPERPFDPTIVFCDTLEEFVAARLEHLSLSHWLKAGEREKLKQRIEAIARETKGGTYGVNAPNGAFLNGWLFNYGQDTPPRALLKNRDQFVKLFGIAIHETIGHDFFNTFSAAGQEQAAVGGQALAAAQEFDLRLNDEPRIALLLQKWNIVNGTSLILKEGWTTWIENLLAPVLFGQPRRVRYTLAQLWGALEGLPYPVERRAMLRWALNTVFLNPPADPRQLLWPVYVLESLVSDNRLRLPQMMEYTLGALLFDRLEANVGLLNVPLAMLTAANLKFELETISTVELQRLVLTEPRFNADWRLAALSGLAWPAPVRWPALAQAASDQLNLAVPPELAQD